ncbi:MAG: ferredoxin--NADP reductase [Bacteroidia bacterium]|nr:ferredoxin--NADP reductase [Bacteroidia bacterium]
MSAFHSLSISSIVPNTPNAVTIYFDVPEDLRSEFAFSPGQYITIRYSLDGEEVRRAYSICSSRSDGSLAIGVKEVADGKFSVYANRKLNEGDSLEVMPPEGRFIFESSGSPQNIAAFAAGSGITPIMSIAREVLESHDENRFVLLYGNQGKDETMFYDELADLQEKYPERFFLQYSFSRASEEGALFGRIDGAKANYLLKNKFQDVSFDSFYLCGPEAMIEEVKSALLAQDIRQEQIFFELFTSPLEDVAPTPQVTDDSKSNIQVILDDEEYTLVMKRKQLLLDAILDADIDAPYSCQGGVCSTCIAKVTEGKVVMEKNQILTDSEIEEGYILTCQSHPTTPTLKIDYDDV